MATQGLLTIMENDKVKYKVICGSDGYNIHSILENYSADELALCTPEELYDIAIEHGFGAEVSLIVSFRNRLGIINHYHKTEELEYGYTPWYWDNFDNPTFNPRWARGDGAITQVIKV